MDKELLRRAAQALGGRDWEWWTSNSYRRLTFKDGQHRRDGGALHAFKNQADGWPDVCMESGVQEFIEAASPKAVMALLDRIEVLGAALQQFADEVLLLRNLEDSDCLWAGPTSGPLLMLGPRMRDLRRAAAAMCGPDQPTGDGNG